jgi:hypothetical protein
MAIANLAGLFIFKELVRAKIRPRQWMKARPRVGAYCSPMSSLSRTFSRCLTLGFSLGMAASLCAQPAKTHPPESASALYSQKGSDPAFADLLKEKKIPVGRNSTEGVTGSAINVNNKLVEQGRNARNPIPKAIAIHTVANSVIPREHFGRWTRWYQEDGKTQVFRLFKGEHNVRNSRPDAARIEAFSRLSWTKGGWHEWQGTYTIVKPHDCAIFQVKNSDNDWGVMIGLSDDGDISLTHRRPKKSVTLAKNMTGKSFDLRIRDNGHDYEVFFNDKPVGAGSYDRPRGTTCFRWGMYDKTLRHDALIFVTGAKFKLDGQPRALAASNPQPPIRP